MILANFLLIRFSTHVHSNREIVASQKFLLNTNSSLFIQSGALALLALLEEARKPTCRVCTENAPFDLKEMLETRGYRWNGGNDGKPKSWYCDIPEKGLEEELMYRSERNIPALSGYSRCQEFGI